MYLVIVKLCVEDVLHIEPMEKEKIQHYKDQLEGIVCGRTIEGRITLNILYTVEQRMSQGKAMEIEKLKKNGMLQHIMNY